MKKWLVTTISHKLNTPMNALIFLRMQYILKKKTTQHTLVLYGTLILEIKVKICTISGKVKYCTLKILLDSGTSATITSGSLLPKSKHKNNTATKWDTCRGVFNTQAKEAGSFQLSELDHTETITYAMNVDDTNNYQKYEMIMGREFIQ